MVRLGKIHIFQDGGIPLFQKGQQIVQILLLQIGKDLSAGFSKEIIIWYSYSFKTCRGKHHFCATPTDEQRKRNAFTRGKRLNAFHEFVAPDLSHVEHMLNEAVFGDPLDKTIQKEIKHSYKNKPMSLKTFWFCYLPDLEKIPGFKRELSKKLFVNTELSDFMSDAEYTLSDYTEVINGVLSVENDISQFALWQQLNIILTYANSVIDSATPLLTPLFF